MAGSPHPCTSSGPSAGTMAPGFWPLHLTRALRRHHGSWTTMHLDPGPWTVHLIRGLRRRRAREPHRDVQGPWSMVHGGPWSMVVQGPWWLRVEGRGSRPQLAPKTAPHHDETGAADDSAALPCALDPGPPPVPAAALPATTSGSAASGTGLRRFAVRCHQEDS